MMEGEANKTTPATPDGGTSATLTRDASKTGIVGRVMSHWKFKPKTSAPSRSPFEKGRV